ncbi:hypothetical protein VPH35_049182 [Triticum aestivum]
MEGDTYKCSRCISTVPMPRYKISLNAIDADAKRHEDSPFARFIFWGQQGEILTEKQVLILVAEANSRAEYTPPELTGLVGKKFTVIATRTRDSLDGEHMFYQVESTEPLFEPANPENAQPPTEETQGENESQDNTLEATPPPSPSAAKEEENDSTGKRRKRNDHLSNKNKRGTKKDLFGQQPAHAGTGNATRTNSLQAFTGGLVFIGQQVSGTAHPPENQGGRGL